MTDGYVMTVSRNGQVSIPAVARARWGVRQVLVVDLGDRVVIRPQPAEALDAMTGKYRGRGPSTGHARRTAHREDAERVRRRR